MNGPFMLEAKTIAREVGEKRIGCFMLCDMTKTVREVGRSDTDLAAELTRRVGSAAWFYFEATSNIKQAFDQECKYYHQNIRSIPKKFHPKKPEGKDWACPLGCGYK